MGNRFSVKQPVEESTTGKTAEAAHVKELTAQDYDAEVTAAVHPVALSFYDKESKPCETLAPRFAAVAEKFAGKARFLKVSRADNAPLAARLGVTASPTIVFLQGGKEKGERLTGDDIKRTDLKARVEAMLGIKPATVAGKVAPAAAASGTT